MFLRFNICLAGGTVLTITGTGFGTTAADVHVGFGNLATVSSRTDTEIVVELPALPRGSYTLMVVTGSEFADVR